MFATWPMRGTGWNDGPVLALVVLGIAQAAIAAARRGHREEQVLGAAAALSAVLACLAANPSGRPPSLSLALATIGLTAFAYAILPRRGPVALAGVLASSASTWVASSDAGARFADGEAIPGLVEGDWHMQLWDASWLQDPLGVAFRLYGEGNVRVRQLVVPDPDNHLPWEEAYGHPKLQPLLFRAPNGVGPRRA